jgi:diacylglycerol kinase family enzyme
MPGGSGNALAFAAGMGEAETAAFAVARGRAMPYDVATVLQENHRFVSFILVAWGIVADVDFESERFRWMGGARFTVSAVQRIAGMRNYKGRFSYYPDRSWKKEKCGAGCVRCLSLSYPGAPQSLPHEEQWSGTAVPLNGSAAVGPFVGMERANLPPGPPTPLLDALQAGNEEGWVTVESDHFVMFCASNATHVASDMKMGPYAHWSDGCWDVVVIKDVSKTALMKLFLSIENGGTNCSFSSSLSFD